MTKLYLPENIFELPDALYHHTRLQSEDTPPVPTLKQKLENGIFPGFYIPAFHDPWTFSRLGEKIQNGEISVSELMYVGFDNHTPEDQMPDSLELLIGKLHNFPFVNKDGLFNNRQKGVVEGKVDVRYYLRTLATQPDYILSMMQFELERMPQDPVECAIVTATGPYSGMSLSSGSYRVLLVVNPSLDRILIEPPHSRLQLLWLGGITVERVKPEDILAVVINPEIQEHLVSELKSFERPIYNKTTGKLIS